MWKNPVLICFLIVLSCQKSAHGSDKKVFLKKILKFLWEINSLINSQGCQLNDVLIDASIFPYFACWKCFETFRTNRKLSKVNCQVQLDNVSYAVPGFIVDDQCVPFDHRSNSISRLVQSSLSDALFERWRRCCSDALECCELMVRDFSTENFFNSCENHWDGQNCYLDTFPDNTVYKLCPHQMTKFDESQCHRKKKIFRIFR